MENQLLEKQLLEAINHFKNVSKKRIKAVTYLKKTVSTNWDQELINGMLCILQRKISIVENFVLKENEEDLTNHEDIDTGISPVISDSKNPYSISSAPLAVHHLTTPSLNLEKLPLTQIATPTLSASSSDFSTSLQQ